MPRALQYWMTKWDAELAELWDRYTNAELAERFGVSERSVRYQARRLNLPPKYDREPTPEEIEKAEELIMFGFCVEAIGEQMRVGRVRAKRILRKVSHSCKLMLNANVKRRRGVGLSYGRNRENSKSKAVL